MQESEAMVMSELESVDSPITEERSADSGGGTMATRTVRMQALEDPERQLEQG